jgi:RNA polymerase sigma-B factor
VTQRAAFADADDGELFASRKEPAAVAAIVERYDGLAHRLALRYRGRGEPVDDLVQVARLGLVNAIERFDPDRGAKFATYATVTISGELKRHLRDKAWSVRVPRSLQERWLEVNRALGDLSQKLGREPTIYEVAEHIDVDPEDVLEALDVGSAYTAGSLDQPVGTEAGSRPLGDLLADRSSGAMEHADHRVDVAGHIDALPDRLQQILYLRFFEGRTQTEIGDAIGVSQMHVSRLLRQALGALREAVANDQADPEVGEDG